MTTMASRYLTAIVALAILDQCCAFNLASTFRPFGEHDCTSLPKPRKVSGTGDFSVKIAADSVVERMIPPYIDMRTSLSAFRHALGLLAFFCCTRRAPSAH